MMLYLGLAIIVIFFLAGTPMYMAFGLGSFFLALWAFNLPLQSIASFFVESINSYTFLAIPLFLVMGNIFVESGASKYLVNFFKKVFERFPGGTGLITIISSAFFAAISGSTIATIAAIGSITAPELKSEGYDEGTVGALTAACGGLGIMIPPSIMLIIYGVMVEQNIAVLFAAGFIPGILAGAMLYVALLYILRKDNISLHQISHNKQKTIEVNYAKTIPALISPIIVLGGIYAGILTPTEAAGISVVYTILIGIFIYRKLSFKKMQESLRRSVITISSISLIVCGGVTMGKMTILSGLPQSVTNFILKINIGPTGFLLMCSVVMLILGLFIEEAVIMLVFVPMVFPTVVRLGISPIQFAIIVIMAIIIGQCTPPYATNLNTATLICKVPFEKSAKKVFPFVIALIIALLFVIFVPEISLFLPRIMGMPLP